MIRVIHAKTHEEAVMHSVGLYHDHIDYWFIGKTEDVPEDKQRLLLFDTPYVFIYEEEGKDY